MNANPPRLATRMLKYLVLRDRKEELEGDLLEQFHQGRSAAWYWRQVLGAIFGLSNVLRIGLITVCAVAFAAAWVYGLCVAACLVTHSPLQTATGNWMPYEGRTVILEGVLFYIALPLCVYLALARNLRLRTFMLGLGAGLLALVVLPSFQSHLATPLNYLLEYGRLKHQNVVVWLHFYNILQGAAPLLAAMFAAALSKTSMGTLDPQEARHHAPEQTNNPS